MKNYQTEFLSQYISNLRISRNLSRLAYQTGNALYLNNHCALQSREGVQYAYTVEDNYQDFHTDIVFNDEDKKIDLQCNCNAEGICSHQVSALLQLHEDLSQEVDIKPTAGMKYTRDGMIKRVMAEREEKAKHDKFQLDFADNIYGEHIITNKINKSYLLTFYDFEKRRGYCSCPDHQTNKLGSCKHLIYAFNQFEKDHINREIPTQDFPFLEVFLHPLKEYKVSWFFPKQLPEEIQDLLAQYFDKEQLVSNKKLLEFQSFIRKAKKYKFIKIRPEVIIKIQSTAEKQSLKELKNNTVLEFDKVGLSLYPYQKEGVEFIVFNKGAILADEVSLGKTLQAIVAAQFKKDLFNLQSVLIVCPDNLIQHWEHEIQKVGRESCIVIKSREDLFNPDAYFKIIGFEDFSRQSLAFEAFALDMIIIDEAQKISNFDSDLVRILKQIKFRHLLIITDSKLENHPMQFYTMVGMVDNTALTPLWEFSYQHCLFDSQILDKIVGYYNQDNISKRIDSILLRRQKQDVFNQLQKINRLVVPCNFDLVQQIQHQKLVDEMSFLLNKKLKTKFDWQKISQLFSQMRTIASLVHLSSISNEASPKFNEFKHFLSEKVNFTTATRKIVVFAEKEENRKQIFRFFKENRVHAELLNSSQTEEERESIILRFEENKSSSCLILQEGVFDLIPEADVILYYDLSFNNQAVEKRFAGLQQQKSIQPPLLVHFLNQDSFEFEFYQLIQEKATLFEELSSFLKAKNEDAELSRELVNKLKNIFQKLHRERSNSNGQTLLFPLGEEKPSISLSGEEHKAFESIRKKKVDFDPKIEKLLKDAHSFISGLYSIQTGKELPWKTEDVDLNVNEDEIILRIKRH